jgi:Domain of unknown function (DUF1772)
VSIQGFENRNENALLPTRKSQTLRMKEFLPTITLTITALMTGLIWFVQVVHYPIFGKVPPEQFTAFHQAHLATTGKVVMLPMILELLCSGLMLTLKFDNRLQNGLNYAAAALTIFIWIVTGFVSVPIHNQLATNGFSASLIEKLVATNWLRTWAWTARTGILLYFLVKR